jgi:hypothetical protein
MPWTTPETFTAGQTLTAASMNAMSENVDFLREGRPSAVTPMVKCVRSGDQSLTSPDLLEWNGTDAYDTDGMHNPSSNNSRITFQTPGIYLVILNVNVTLTGTAISQDVYITGGAAATPVAAYFVGASVSVAVSSTVSTLVDSSAFAYVEANVNFPSATAAKLKANDRSSFLATWVGKLP